MSDKTVYELFHVGPERGEQKKAYWQRVGRAFANKDGKTFTLVIDYLPTFDNGEGYGLKLQMQPPRPPKEDDFGG